MKEEIIFPWITSVSDRFCKTFASDYLLEDLQFLWMNINTEVNQALQKQSKDKTRSLFAVLINFYNHFCGKLKNQKDPFHLNVVCAKILSSLISVGLILSNGKTASKWMQQILGPIRMFPGNFETIYHSLLLVTNLKKKYQACYSIILRQLLCSEFQKSVMNPETYMTAMLLCRRLKRISKKQDGIDVLSVVSKIEPPPNIQDWLFEKVGDMQLKRHKLLSTHLMTSKLPISAVEKIRKVILKKWCLKNSAQNSTVQKKEDELFVIDTGILPETKSVSSDLKSKKKKKKITSESIATNSKLKKRNEKKMDGKFSKKLSNNKKTSSDTSRNLESYRVDLPEALRPLSCHCDALKQKSHKKKYELKQLKNCQTLCSSYQKLVITVEGDADTKAVRPVKKRKIVSEDCHENDPIAADRCGTKTKASSSCDKTSVSHVQSVKKRKKHAVVTKCSDVSMMGEPNETDNLNNMQSSSELCIKAALTKELNEEINKSNTCNFSEQKNEMKNVDQDKNLICTTSPLSCHCDALKQKSHKRKYELKQLKNSQTSCSSCQNLVITVEGDSDTKAVKPVKKRKIVSEDCHENDSIAADRCGTETKAGSFCDKTSVSDVQKERDVVTKRSDVSVMGEPNETDSLNNVQSSSELCIKAASTNELHEEINKSNTCNFSEQKGLNTEIKNVVQDKYLICSTSEELPITEKMMEPSTQASSNSNAESGIDLIGIASQDINTDGTHTIKSSITSKSDEELTSTNDEESITSKSDEELTSTNDEESNDYNEKMLKKNGKKYSVNFEKHISSGKESSTNLGQPNIISIQHQSNTVPEEETNPSVVHCTNDSQNKSCLSRNDRNANELLCEKLFSVDEYKSNIVKNVSNVKDSVNLTADIENVEKIPNKDEVIPVPDLEINHGEDENTSLTKEKSEFHLHSTENVPFVEEKSEFHSNNIESQQSCERPIEKISKESPIHSRQSELVAVKDQSTASEEETDPSVRQYTSDSGDVISWSQNGTSVSSADADANEMAVKKDTNLENDAKAVLPDDEPKLLLHSIQVTLSCDSTIENINKESSTHSGLTKIVAVEDQSRTVSNAKSNPRFDCKNTIPCSQKQTCVSREGTNFNEMPNKKEKNLETITTDNEAVLPADLEIIHADGTNVSHPKEKSELYSHSIKNIPLLEIESEFGSHSAESKQSCDYSIENLHQVTHSEQSETFAIKGQSSAVSEEESNPSVVQCMNDSESAIPCAQNEICNSGENANAYEMPDKKEKSIDKIVSDNEAISLSDLEINHGKEENISVTKEKPELCSHSTDNIPLLEEKSESGSPGLESKQSCDSTIGNINEESPTHSGQSKMVSFKDQSSTVLEENNPSVVQCRNDFENAIMCTQNETCVSTKDKNYNNMPEKNDIVNDVSKRKNVINITNSKDNMKLAEDISIVEKITRDGEVIQVPDPDIKHDIKESITLAKGKSELHSHSTENIPLLEEKSEFHSHSVESKESCDFPIEDINKKSSTHSEQTKVTTKNKNSVISKEENNPHVVYGRKDYKNSIPCSQRETHVSREDTNINQMPNKKEKNLENSTSDIESVLPGNLEITHDNDTDVSHPKEKPEFHSHDSEFKQSHDSALKKVSQCEGDMKSPKKSNHYVDLKLIGKHSCSPYSKEGNCLGLSSSDSEYMTLEEMNDSSEEFLFVDSSDSVDEIETSKSSICTGKTNKRSKHSTGSMSLNPKRKRNNLSSDMQQSTQSKSKECPTDEKLVDSVSFPDSVVSKQYLSFAEVSELEEESLGRRILPSVQSTCQSKSDISEKNVHCNDNVSSKYNIEATTSKVGNKISVLVEVSKKKPNELDFENAENLSLPDSKKHLVLTSRTEENTPESEKNTEKETLPYSLRSTRSHTVSCSEIICIPSTDDDDSETSNKKSPRVSFEVKVNMGKRCDGKESMSSREMLSIETDTHSKSENKNITLCNNNPSASIPLVSCIEDSISHELSSKQDRNSDSVHRVEVARKPVTRSKRQEVEKMSTGLNHNNGTLSMNQKDPNFSNMRITNLFFENVHDETDSMYSSQGSCSSVGSNIIESDNSDTSGVTQADRKKTLRSRSKKVTKEKATSNVKPKIYPLRRRNVNNTESSNNNSQLGIDLSTLSLKSPCIEIPLLSVEGKITGDKSATVSPNKVSKEGSRNVFNYGEIELPKRETRSSTLKAANDDEKLEQKSAGQSYNLRSKRSIIAPSRLNL